MWYDTHTHAHIYIDIYRHNSHIPAYIYTQYNYTCHTASIASIDGAPILQELLRFAKASQLSHGQGLGLGPRWPHLSLKNRGEWITWIYHSKLVMRCHESKFYHLIHVVFLFGPGMRMSDFSDDLMKTCYAICHMHTFTTLHECIRLSKLLAACGTWLLMQVSTISRPSWSAQKRNKK